MQFLGKIGQIIGWRPPLGNPGSATALTFSSIAAGQTRATVRQTNVTFSNCSQYRSVWWRNLSCEAINN